MRLRQFACSDFEPSSLKLFWQKFCNSQSKSNLQFQFYLIMPIYTYVWTSGGKVSSGVVEEDVTGVNVTLDGSTVKVVKGAELNIGNSVTRVDIKWEELETDGTSELSVGGELSIEGAAELNVGCSVADMDWFWEEVGELDVSIPVNDEDWFSEVIGELIAGINEAVEDEIKRWLITEWAEELSDGISVTDVEEVTIGLELITDELDGAAK